MFSVVRNMIPLLRIALISWKHTESEPNQKPMFSLFLIVFNPNHNNPSWFCFSIKEEKLIIHMQIILQNHGLKSNSENNFLKRIYEEWSKLMNWGVEALTYGIDRTKEQGKEPKSLTNIPNSPKFKTTIKGAPHTTKIIILNVLICLGKHKENPKSQCLLHTWITGKMGIIKAPMEENIAGIS